MNGAHLSEDRVIEVCLLRTPGACELQHLERCPRCEQRRSDIARMLTELSGAAAADADAAFPAERLARQHARILQRIEDEARPARVIAFPAGRANDPPPLRARPGMRWMAGAAAAGLVIGLLAGYLTHDFSGMRSGRPVQTAAGRPLPAEPALRAVPTTLSEEEFLGQLEIAIEGSSASALRPLDDLTPRVWEVTAR
jgi:hypothetical protein